MLVCGRDSIERRRCKYEKEYILYTYNYEMHTQRNDNGLDAEL